MSDDMDDPFAGIGEKDRIRKPTRLTLAQLGIMAGGVAIAVVGLLVSGVLMLEYEWDVREVGPVVAACFGIGYGVYRNHWRYRQQD